VAVRDTRQPEPVLEPAKPDPGDAPGEGIDHEGDVDEARPSRNVREVGHPKDIRPERLEVAVHAVERARCRRVAHRRADRLAPNDTAKAHRAHLPRHRAAGDLDPLAPQLPPDFPHAVDLEVLVPDPPDVAGQLGVPLGTGWQLRRITPTGNMLVVRRRGDRQQPADRLDPMDVAMIVDKRDHGFDRRSSSAIAKYAEAFRRISFACRSSRTSRSKALMRSRSSLVGPARTPWSRSAWRTQPRSVSAVHPIFDAIELIAAHSETCSPRCSNTIRTARARNSSEYLVSLLIAPSSQGLEPPANPARFIGCRPEPFGDVALFVERRDGAGRDPTDGAIGSPQTMFQFKGVLRPNGSVYRAAHARLILRQDVSGLPVRVGLRGVGEEAAADQCPHFAPVRRHPVDDIGRGSYERAEAFFALPVRGVCPDAVAYGQN
jgi:hypothetical protein